MVSISPEASEGLEVKPLLKEAYHIYGRSTKMGAETYLEVAKVSRGVIKVERLNESKSGRHWEEVLLVSDDAEGIVYHVDITNSGKHYCRVLGVKDGAVAVLAEAKGGRCPIHHDRWV